VARCGILRIEKRQSGNVGKIGNHIDREPGYESKSNPDGIDPSRTGQNWWLVDRRNEGSIEERINARIDALKAQGCRKIRKDAVRMVDFVFDGPEDVKDAKFWGDCLAWVQDLVGVKNVVSAVVHMDEGRPHLHVATVPVVWKDGKEQLCAKELLNRNQKNRGDGYRALQESFYQKVCKERKLDRRTPAEESGAKHINKEEFRAIETLRKGAKKMEEEVKILEARKKNMEREFFEMAPGRVIRESKKTISWINEQIEEMKNLSKKSIWSDEERVTLDTDRVVGLLRDFEKAVSEKIDWAQMAEYTKKSYEGEGVSLVPSGKVDKMIADEVEKRVGDIKKVNNYLEGENKRLSEWNKVFAADSEKATREFRKLHSEVMQLKEQYPNLPILQPPKPKQPAKSASISLVD
jgi:hypothetical protein